MSSPLGNCSARVFFKCRKGSYTVAWRQEARFGSEEPLIVWELYDEKGTLLSNLSKSIQTKILELTGLSFEKYMKGGILSFDAFIRFLQSSPEERASLFKKLTKEIAFPSFFQTLKDFSQHQREKLLTIRHQLSEIDILSREKEDQFKDDLIRLERSLQETDSEIQKKHAALQWLTELNELKEEIQKIQKEEHELKGDIDRFALKKPVLENAIKALEINPVYEQVKSERERLAIKEKELGELDKSLPIVKEKARNAQTNLSAQEAVCKQEEEKFLNMKRILEKVFVLDGKISELKKTQEEKQSSLNQKSALLTSLNENLLRLKTQNTEQTARKKNLQMKINELICDEDLVNNLDSYREQLDLIDDYQRQIEQFSVLQKEAQRDIEVSSSRLAQILEDLSRIRKEEQTITFDLTQRDRELLKLLGKETVDSLQSEHDGIIEKLSVIEELRSATDKLLLLEQSVESQKTENEKLAAENKVAAIKLAASEETLKDKKEIVELIRQKIEFQKRVESLEAERKHLVNGKPCPLCGAIHHPYSTNLNLDLKAEEKFKTAQREEEECENERLQTMQAISEIKLLIEKGEEKKAKLEEDVESTKADIFEKAQDIGIPGLRGKKPFNWLAVFKQRFGILSNRKTDLVSKLEKVSLINSGIEAIKENLAANQEKLAQAQKENAEISRRLGADQTKLENLKQEDTSIKNTRDEIIRTLERSFQKYSLNSTTLSQLKQSFGILEKRKINWLIYQEEMSQLVQESGKIAQEVALCSETLEEDQKTFNALKTENDSLIHKIKELSKERYDLFGNQDTDQAQLHTRTQLQNAENLKADLEKISLEKQKELAVSEDERNSLAEEVGSIKASLKDLERKLAEALKGKDFVSETTFLACRISDSQREQLQLQQTMLTERSASLEKKKKEKEELFSLLKAKKLTSDNKNVLENKLILLKDKTAKDKSAEARIKEILQKNAEDKERYKKEKRFFDDQNLLLEKWEKFTNLAFSASKSTENGALEKIYFQVLTEMANQELRLYSPALYIAADKEYEIELKNRSEDTVWPVNEPFNPQNVESVAFCYAMALSQLTLGTGRLDFLFILNEASGALVNGHAAFPILSPFVQAQGKVVCLICEDPSEASAAFPSVEVKEDMGGHKFLEGPGVSAF